MTNAELIKNEIKVMNIYLQSLREDKITVEEYAEIYKLITNNTKTIIEDRKAI